MSVAMVDFDYTMWATRFPEFSSTVSASLAQLYWNEAGLYLSNTPCNGIISDPVRMQLIMNLLTAHIAQLYSLSNVNGSTQAASQLAGRISSATEGSVSVSVDMGPVTANSAWYLQTKYGNAAWAALAPYRTMRYFPGTKPYLGTGPAYFGRRL